MGISTHVLNTASGRPAANVQLSLERLDGVAWVHENEAWTDTDGRCKHALPEGVPLQAATYRLRFDTGVYFAAQGTPGLYPYVEIVFTVHDPAQHYHIPLLLTPNGYTTYRGS
jgi:5-hydroxyisourate hydrolase